MIIFKHTKSCMANLVLNCLLCLAIGKRFVSFSLICMITCHDNALIDATSTIVRIVDKDFFIFFASPKNNQLSKLIQLKKWSIEDGEQKHP